MTLTDIEREQKEMCKHFGATWFSSPAHMTVGVAENVRTGLLPLNGLRHRPEGDTTGWYIWAGDELSRDPAFFKPLHTEHLKERCPLVLKYLGLPPGWRFLVTENYEDVWYDPSLLRSVGLEPLSVGTGGL
ncbi:MAG: hypothetical protein AABX97_05910 [Candidatus Thermoplasmatota archaeon]